MAQEVTNFARFYGILKKSYKFATKELGDEFKEGKNLKLYNTK